MESRVWIKDVWRKVGGEVTIAGWVDARRDHGKLIFFDLRDETGKVQVVVPSGGEIHQQASRLRSEWVLKVAGLVKNRPDSMANHNETNGKIEIEASAIEILNESEPLPFSIHEDTKQIDENVRLSYRYLDLRSERLQKNIRCRSEFIRRTRDFLFQHGFNEIETPLLSKATPEGARDFVVPSRLHPGKFFALPQSPQQYKQLLMIGGFERYFQIARCLRDEDLRSDRGFEHTQVDIEMAFVSQNDILDLVEKMVVTVIESLGLTIKEKPFPRITYQEAKNRFGADKFDLRTESDKKQGVMAYAWVVDFPFFERTDDGKWTFTHNPFSMPKEDRIDDLLNGKNIGDILTTQYDLVCNGFEAGGGSIRAHRADILEATYRIMGYSDKETEDSVGHMLQALKLGAPPHGGIALGVERNVMNLVSEEAIREVQAFPMTRRGQTAVMKAPAPIPENQLADMGLAIKEKTHESRGGYI